MESRQRQTAYKIWIKDIVNNKLIKQEGEWDPSYVEVNGEKISRVNIIAVNIFKYKAENGEYYSITLDDSSDTIRLKAWREDSKLLENINVGDIVLVVGRVKEYNDEIYILPEIVKVVKNPNWELARKLELFKKYGKPSQKIERKEEIKTSNEEQVEETKTPDEQQVEEEVVDDNQSTNGVRQKILDVIEKLDVEEGVDKESLLNTLGIEQEKTNTALLELLKEGEIYELKPGKLKITK
jgi:RPA family protein